MKCVSRPAWFKPRNQQCTSNTIHGNSTLTQAHLLLQVSFFEGTIFGGWFKGKQPLFAVPTENTRLLLECFGIGALSQVADVYKHRKRWDNTSFQAATSHFPGIILATVAGCTPFSYGRCFCLVVSGSSFVSCFRHA